MPAKQKESSTVSPIVLVLFLIALIALSIGAYLYAKRSSTQQPSTKISSIPTPTPIVLRPDNGLKGTYAISQGKHTGPTITQVIFDPLDVKKGQTLTVTISVNHTQPIQKVSATLEGDDNKQVIELQRIDGSDTKGIWQGSVKLTGSVNYLYVLRMSAVAADGTNMVVTAPRSR